MAKVGYVYTASAPSFTSANDVLDSADFVALAKNASGKYVITAAVNGWYTIAAKDTEGFTSFTEEKITNIDRTAPGVVTDLCASYSKNTKKITVSWVNPAESDFYYVSLSYTKAGTAVASDVWISNGMYTVSGVEIDGDEYVFSVYAVDKAGNKGAATTASITPKEGVGVQSITLDRYHIAYNDTNQNVTAVVTLSNDNLITDDTVVKIQIKDTDGNETDTTTTVDKAAGKATATFKLPSSSSNSKKSGMTYTVLCKIDDDVADTAHTARFNVSAPASLSELSQSTDGTSFTTSKVQVSLPGDIGKTKETVRIQGYNLDLTTPYIQLYDSTGAAYYTDPVAVDTSAIVWTETAGTHSQILDTEIPVPTVDDSYTVRVLFGDVAQTSFSRMLQVYDVPKFTSFTIPLVSYAKEGNTVTATIIGKNFSIPDIDLSNFTATCASKTSVVKSTSFTRASDSKLTATFTIPGTVGDYEITVCHRTNSITGTLKVQDFGAYNVGDVLLNDGTIIPYDAENLTFTSEQKTKAVGVLYGINEYGVPGGWLGLHKSSDRVNRSDYAWAPYGTMGYNTKFNDIICTPSNSGSGAADTATFTGDTNGNDNWAYISSVDPACTAKAETYYPAFNYVNNYATTFGLTGAYANGWYMPSLAELCYIYKNKTVLNTVLDALTVVVQKGQDAQNVQDEIQLYNGSYWSSSQSDAGSNAWRVNFDNGNIYASSKSGSKYVCCVRAFN